MKLIKISADLELTVHEFPDGSYIQQNKAICNLIGADCRVYEHVMPERLYTELHMKNHPTQIPGQCVSMLVDEESLLKENTPNLIGSYLYKTDEHNTPIMGSILFVGEAWNDDGIDFCGIEDETFKLLERELNNMVYAMKCNKGGIG